MRRARRNPEEEYAYVVACGWCRKVLRVAITHDPRMAGRISDGICPDCSAKVQRELSAMKRLGRQR